MVLAQGLPVMARNGINGGDNRRDMIAKKKYCIGMVKAMVEGYGTRSGIVSLLMGNFWHCYGINGGICNGLIMVVVRKVW